jgi:type IV pilus assembly protein PilB
MLGSMDLFDLDDPARLDDYLARLAGGLDPRLGHGHTPTVDLRRIAPDPNALAQIPGRAARRLHGLPLRRHGHLLAVAMAHPDDAESRQSMGFLTDCTVIPFAADPAQLTLALAEHYDRQDDVQIARDLGLDDGEMHNEPGSPMEMERIAGQAPIIRLINEALADAIARRASDLHLRPGEHQAELLYRIDDELVPVRRFLAALLPALVSRIKVIGRMNLAEHRTAQDGRTSFTLPDGRAIDLRISVLPSIHGESVAIRLLDTSQGLRDLGQIGLSPRDRERIDDLITRDHGLFLVCGPTGCGKTTTLYAVLQALAKQRINILTIEDPVEYRIDGIQQMQVNRPAGFSFATAMRNFLRHDPDVIMVGEIRDRETAEIAIESALTGHLVLSTLHTNTAATAVTRLLDLGVEPYLLRASLLAAMSQRLVRKVCPACREATTPDPRIAGLLGVPADATVWKGRGCAQCEGLGVRGRAAAYELMVTSPGILPLIHAGAEADRIHATAVAEGMVPLTATAAAMAMRGEIALEEAFRARTD